MPISFSLTDTTVNQIGQAVALSLTPHLMAIQHEVAHVGQIVQSLATLIDSLVVRIVQPIEGIELMSLGVYLNDPEMRDHIEATRWAVAYFSYNTFLEALRALWGIYARLGQLNQTVVGIGDFLNGAIYPVLTAILATLQAILAQLQSGITVSGNVTLTIDLGAGLTGVDLGDLALQLLELAGAAALLTAALAVLTPAIIGLSIAFAVLAAAVALLAGALHLMPDNLPEIVDALILLGIGLIVLGAAIAVVATRGKLAAQLALGFLGIAVFLYLLAGALQLMPDNLQDIVSNLIDLGLGLMVLGAAIALLKRDKLEQIALGFLGIAIFLGLVGLALRLFNEQTLQAIPALNQLFEGLINLGNAIAGFSQEQLQQIGLGFLGIAAFIALLGLALKLFNAETLAAVPGLENLFNGLVNLANAIAAFSTEQLIQIGLGFLGIAAFIALLGLALKLFNAETLAAVPGLENLFNGLVNLANAIAAFSTEQLIQIGLGFLGIVIFVALLGLALQTFTDQALQALPALAQLMESFNSLISTLAGLSPGQLFSMAIAFSLMAGFVLALSAATSGAAPGLNALANVLARMESLLNSVSSAARSAASAISSISGGGGFSVPGFQMGGVMPHTGLAFLHEGERVLSVGETQSLEAGVLQPAAGPAASPLPAGLAGAALPPADQSINIEGGININISAERVDPDTAELLSDEIVQRLLDRLNAEQTARNFRSGVRSPAAA